MSDAVISAGRYYGCYRHKLDDKKRLPIPFRWRPEEPIELTLVIWPKHQAGTCLRVLTPEGWAKLVAAIDAMPSKDPNKTVLSRGLGTRAALVKLDNAGRIAIPNEMAQAADITNEAVLAGLINRFEIWSPKRYAQVEASDDALVSQALQEMD
jgi:division/cell wall cluster transcriptional repressor MraZ